jgi:hypothetical protein
MNKTSDKLKERWLRFNIRGEGSRKSSRMAKYSYTGPIYYSHGWPVARLVQLPGGNYACLNKHHIWPANPKEWTYGSTPRLATNLNVPDVAAFSSYDGDWLSDNKLHERLRNLWMMIAAYQVELARDTAFPTLVTGDPNGINGLQRSLRSQLQSAAKEYSEYSAAFQLGWHSFPTIYGAELEQIIEDRKRVYFSPSEVAKRERREARAGAKMALGLDNKEKKK